MALWIMLAAAAASHVQSLRPAGDTTRWFTNKDYPTAAVLAHEEGLAKFEVAIDATGLPTACKITGGTGSATLDAATCQLLMGRARFEPATDRHGNPVPAIYRQSVRWRLPASAHSKGTDPSFDAHSTLAGGQVADCQMTGGTTPRAGASCGAFGNREFLAYYLKDDIAKTKSTDVRLNVAADDAPAPALKTPPTLYKVLAKATLTITADGNTASCKSISKLEALGRSIDLCDFIRGAPPRFQAGTATRQGTILLDLSAYTG